jgi:hypothetical protein
VALKFKPSKRTITIALVAALAVCALLVSRARSGDDTGNAGVLDDAANRACSTFAAGYGKAKSDTSRLALADRVTSESARTDNKTIRKRASDLGVNADEGTTKWKASASTLTKACRDAGWKKS